MHLDKYANQQQTNGGRFWANAKQNSNQVCTGFSKHGSSIRNCWQKQNTVNISPPFYTLCRIVLAVLQNGWLHGNRRGGKNVSEEEDREVPAARTSTWFEGRLNRSTPLSPPLQITRDTRLREARSKWRSLRQLHWSNASSKSDKREVFHLRHVREVNLFKRKC